MAEDAVDARVAALSGLFDDAAIFPPASRSLADAVARHRQHRAGAAAWLVQRLLVRASDTPELSSLLVEDDDLELGVLLDRRAAGGFGDAVAADLSMVARIALDQRVRVTALEVAAESGDQVAELLAAIAGAALPPSLQLAVEAPVAGRPPGQALDVLEALGRARAGVGGGGTGGAGGAGVSLIAKVRCGGVLATAIPTDEELAGFMLACARLDLPFKATAGLHHPTRTVNDAHGGLEHGFLNLLAAVATAAAVASGQGRRPGGDDASGLGAITGQLARRPEGLRLGPGGMVVGEELVAADMLRTLRHDAFIGIGCCEVPDPVADLAERGVLTTTGALA